MSKAKVICTVFEQNTYRHGQSWHHESMARYGRPFENYSHLTHNGTHREFTLRVHIERNSFNQQSSIRGFVLDPQQHCWNQLVWRPIEGSRSEQLTYTNKDRALADDTMAADAREIYDLLMAILGGEIE